LSAAKAGSGARAESCHGLRNAQSGLRFLRDLRLERVKRFERLARRHFVGMEGVNLPVANALMYLLVIDVPPGERCYLAYFPGIAWMQ
jgi:hypothetical protein